MFKLGIAFSLIFLTEVIDLHQFLTSFNSAFCLYFFLLSARKYLPFLVMRFYNYYCSFVRQIFVVCTDTQPSDALDSELLEILDCFSNSITLHVQLPSDVYTTEDHLCKFHNSSK